MLECSLDVTVVYVMQGCVTLVLGFDADVLGANVRAFVLRTVAHQQDAYIESLAHGLNIMLVGH